MDCPTFYVCYATSPRSPNDPPQAPPRPQPARFTRLTNAFSKKVENHAAAIALHTMYYNFVRIHQTLRVTPAMAAGVTDKLWEVSDIVAMLRAMGASELQAGISIRGAPI